jgi:hypothetical protein
MIFDPDFSKKSQGTAHFVELLTYNRVMTSFRKDMNVHTWYRAMNNIWNAVEENSHGQITDQLKEDYE